MNCLRLIPSICMQYMAKSEYFVGSEDTVKLLWVRRYSTSPLHSLSLNITREIHSYLNYYIQTLIPVGESRNLYVHNLKTRTVKNARLDFDLTVGHKFALISNTKAICLGHSAPPLQDVYEVDMELLTVTRAPSMLVARYRCMCSEGTGLLLTPVRSSS